MEKLFFIKWLKCWNIFIVEICKAFGFQLYEINNTNIFIIIL